MWRESVGSASRRLSKFCARSIQCSVHWHFLYFHSVCLLILLIHLLFVFKLGWKLTWQSISKSTCSASTMLIAMRLITSRYTKSASYLLSLRLSKVPKLLVSHTGKQEVERHLPWWEPVMDECQVFIYWLLTTSSNFWICIQTWNCTSHFMKYTVGSSSTCSMTEHLCIAEKMANSKSTLSIWQRCK